MLRQRKNKIIIGLTGSFGSGKSAVAKIFKSKGAKVLDADRIAHDCMRKGSSVYRKVVSLFGEGILNKTKEIDRPRLGDIVFKNNAHLKKLNSIVHPEVIRKIKNELRRIKKGVIILDAPLLLEAGLGPAVDKIVVVKLNKDTQIKRLLKKGNLSRAKIRQIIKSQIPLRQKLRIADFIIDNNGRLSETVKQVAEIRKALVRLA